jgi:hypothetical protein
MLVMLVALICGCTHVPSQDAARIRAAFHSYLSIGKGATRSQVVSLLGREFRRESDGAYYWEVRYDSLNYASLRIRFDSSDRVNDTLVTRGWGNQDSASQEKPVAANE